MDFNVINKLQKKSKNYLDKKVEYYKENKPEVYNSAMNHGKALVSSVMIARINYLLYTQLVASFEELLQNDTKTIKYIYDGKEEEIDLKEELDEYKKILNDGYIQKK